jgi:hypothetical protein
MEKERAYTERLAGQIQEVVNRNTLVSLVLPTGYNAFLPVYDAGVDLILYRESDVALRKCS